MHPYTVIPYRNGLPTDHIPANTYREAHRIAKSYQDDYHQVVKIEHLGLLIDSLA